ncbi:hypothetical protein D3C72_2562170 [compost metagenome]
MLFAAMAITGCIGVSAVLNYLIADPVERLRSRLRTDAKGAGTSPAADAARRPQAPAQPMGTIRRVP